MKIFGWVTGVAGTVVVGTNLAAAALAAGILVFVLAFVIAGLGWLYIRATPRDRKDILELIRAVRGRRPPDSS